MSPAGAVSGLSPGGWAFLLLAWGGIAALTAYCFLKVLRTQVRKR